MNVFSIAETMGGAVIWIDNFLFLFSDVDEAFWDPINALAWSTTVTFSWM